MLMLTRRSGSSIQVGEDITIVIADITPTQVRIGIEAPRNVKIIRGELVDRCPVTSGTTPGAGEIDDA